MKALWAARRSQESTMTETPPKAPPKAENVEPQPSAPAAPSGSAKVDTSWRGVHAEAEFDSPSLFDHLFHPDKVKKFLEANKE
jgi:hypothetical protein